MNNKYIELFKNKTEINLSWNNIDYNEILLICKALEKNTTLKKLYLSGNNISVKGAKVLAKNKTLKVLNLSYNNNISDEGTKILAKNKTLEILNLSYNNISDEGTKILAKNTTLKELELRGVHISRNLSIQIVNNIINNNKRQKLSILTTNIIETNKIEIPDYYPKTLLKY